MSCCGASNLVHVHKEMKADNESDKLFKHFLKAVQALGSEELPV